MSGEAEGPDRRPELGGRARLAVERPTRSYRVDGREVTIPVRVRDARSWFATFLVPRRSARSLIAYSGLEPAPTAPSRALVSLAFVRYVDGDLDPYHEIAVAVLVRPPDARGRRDVGAFIHRLPVDQPFTCSAGREIWGFPKFVADIAIVEDHAARATLRVDDVEVLRMSVARGLPMPTRDVALAAYSWRDGVRRRTTWTLEGEGSRGRPGGVRIVLGPPGCHPIADELRALGFPRRALMSGSMRRVRMSFDDAREC